ncbi:hypothetical protein GGI42DRAFT_320412 [Trichoderma sp. SZMC 28013]
MRLTGSSLPLALVPGNLHNCQTNSLTLVTHRCKSRVWKGAVGCQGRDMEGRCYISLRRDSVKLVRYLNSV